MYRKTWLEVDLDAIRYNVEEIGKIAKKKLIAVVKADGYGCGDIRVLEACCKGGCVMAAVSSLDEAVVLRNEGYAGDILILGTISPEDIDVAVQYDIACAAYSEEWVNLVCQKNCEGLRVHMAIDTGMNRIGFKEIPAYIHALQTLVNHRACVEGIFTHFYCSNVFDHIITDRQAERFHAFLSSYDYPYKWIHADNSDAALFRKDTVCNAARIGITLYGISDYPNDLKHPISLYTTVSMCKKVAKGETIGYGAVYTATEDEVIVTAPIGYADGFLRQNQGRKVYIDGHYGEIVGRVCMDQVMIKVDKKFSLGTSIEIFGKHIAIEDMANELETIPYEILTLISPRVTRIYRDGNNTYEQNDRMASSMYFKR